MSDDLTIRPRITVTDANVVRDVLHACRTIPELSNYFAKSELAACAEFEAKLRELSALAETRKILRGLT